MREARLESVASPLELKHWRSRSLASPLHHSALFWVGRVRSPHALQAVYWRRSGKT